MPEKKETTYLDRMHEEETQLEERIVKLSEFICKNNLFKGFPIKKRKLMEGQLNAMQNYHYFLQERIALEESKQ